MKTHPKTTSYVSGKRKFLAPSLKNSFFYENSLEIFITVCSGVFISPLIFTTIFWVFSFLIAFVHFTNFLYLKCFFSGTSFLGCCAASASDLIERFLIKGVFYLALLPCICHSTASTMDLRELFLLSGICYLTLLPDICHNLLISRLPWEPEVILWGLYGHPLRFETQAWSICSFESYSVQ